MKHDSISKSMPFDESKRLEKLKEYQLFGTPPEPKFDEIVELAAAVCGSKSALLSLVGEHALWFKARYGYDAETGPRDGSFCHHAAMHPDVMIIEDATQDSRFMANPLVTCPSAHVRFYAGAPLKTEDGLPIGVICAIDDQPKKLNALQTQTLKVLANQVMAQMELHKSLLQMREYSDQMRLLNRNKDRFFSIIAHDLRAAFHGILGFSEVLDTEFEDLDTDAIKKIASYLNQSSQSTFKLLENLLEWAMIENGSMRFRPEVLMLERVVDAVVTGLHLSATQKNIFVSFKVDSAITIYGDVHMMQSLIHNLVSNAIKFTPSGGSIFVSGVIQHDHVILSIEDTGLGMTQHQLDHLFHIELSQSTKGTSGEVGTGLGLLLCKQFVTQHQGEIWVQSAVNQGSTFTIQLPLHTQQQASEHHQRS